MGSLRPSSTVSNRPSPRCIKSQRQPPGRRPGSSVGIASAGRRNVRQALPGAQIDDAVSLATPLVVQLPRHAYVAGAGFRFGRRVARRIWTAMSALSGRAAAQLRLLGPTFCCASMSANSAQLRQFVETRRETAETPTDVPFYSSLILAALMRSLVVFHSASRKASSSACVDVTGRLPLSSSRGGTSGAFEISVTLA